MFTKTKSLYFAYFTQCDKFVPCHNFIIAAMKNIYKDIILLFLFGIALPTFDSISDTVLGFHFINSGKTWWGICVLLPVMTNTALTMVLWFRFEESELKMWSWILVLCQVWPQFKALKVVLMYWNGHRTGNQDLIQRANEAKKEFQRGISTLEPFVESVPQVLILCNIWLKTSVIGTSIDKAVVTKDLDVLAGHTRWMFYCALSLSVFTASLGMVKFFKVGPIHFLPKMYHQILALVSTALFLLFKGVALAVLIYSASATFPALLTTYNNTLLVQETPCPSVTFVKKDEGRTWKTLRHMHVVLNTSLHSKWNSNPKYAPPGTKWIYFYEDESKTMFTQGNNNSEGTVQDCMEDPSNCRTSMFSNSDFYCTDVTKMGTLLWVLLMILPVFCVNIGILAFTLRKQFVNVVSIWPPLLFSGSFSPYLFGSVTRRKDFALSPLLTGANLIIACCQATVAFLLLNKMKEPVIDSSARANWRPGKSVINEAGSLTSDLQTMMLSFLLFSLFFTCILLLLLERGTRGSSHDRWREPFKVGVLDPNNPHEPKLLSADKIFSALWKTNNSSVKPFELTSPTPDGRTQNKEDRLIQSSLF